MARRVRLYSKARQRFPLIVEARVRLRSRSCIGEAVACNDHATPSFDRIRYRSDDPAGSHDRASGCQGRVGQGLASSVFNIERPCG
jgi:hypothetical protein